MGIHLLALGGGGGLRVAPAHLLRHAGEATPWEERRVCHEVKSLSTLCTCAVWWDVSGLLVRVCGAFIDHLSK